MTNLTIKDLAASETLDARSMVSVRGGAYLGGFPFPSSMFSLSRDDFKFDATQMMQQSQNTQVNNGNNVAFVSGITSNVTPTQTGSNNIRFL
jgi:hypothetical protein